MSDAIGVELRLHGVLAIDILPSLHLVLHESEVQSTNGRNQVVVCARLLLRRDYWLGVW